MPKPDDDTTDRPARAGSGVKPRFNLPLTVDRKRIALDAMQDRTRDELRALLADPELRAGLDLPASGAASAAPVSALEMNDIAAVLYGAVSRVATIVATKNGYTAYQATALDLTEKELEALIPPTGKVLAKYMPADLGKYNDEISLAVALLAVIQAKVALLKSMPAQKPANIPNNVRNIDENLRSGSQVS